MNQQPDTTTSIIDDQELAQALAGVNNKPEPVKQADDEIEEVQEEQEQQEQVRQAAPLDLNNLTSRGNNTKNDDTSVDNSNNEIEENMPSTNIPQRGDLQSLKMAAVEELRPLVDKLNIPNDEKFDVYLLLIRSTDDESLLSPAHEVATQIEDESRRAMALLDIIKETDYLSNKQNSPQTSNSYSSNQEEYVDSMDEIQQPQMNQNNQYVDNSAFANQPQQYNQQQQTQPQEQQTVQGPNNGFADQQQN